MNPNSEATNALCNALQLIANGGSTTQMENARQTIEKLRVHPEYLTVLTKIIESNFQQNLKVIAAIELKNFFRNPPIKNSLNHPQIIQILKNLLSLYFQPLHKLIATQISLSVSFITMDQTQLMPDLMTLLNQKTDDFSNKMVFERAISLLIDMMTQIYKSNIAPKSLIPIEITSKLSRIWSEMRSEISISTRNDQEENSKKSVEIFVNLTNALYYCICCDLDEERSINVLNDLVAPLTKFIEEIASLNDRNEQTEEVFKASLDILAGLRSKHPLEFLLHLESVLEAVFKIFFSRKLGADSSFHLLKFINDIFNCREYRSESAALLSLRKKCSKETVQIKQRGFVAFLGGSFMKPFLSSLMELFVQFGTDEIESWCSDSENFYEENYLTPFVNSRSVALNIIRVLSSIVPEEMSNFQKSLLVQNSGTENEAKFNQKSAVYLGFGECIENIKGELEKKGFNFEIWLEMISRDLSENNKTNAKNQFLKFAFCEAMRRVSPLFSTPKWFAVKEKIVNQLIEFMKDSDISVQMSSEYAVRTILKDSEDYQNFHTKLNCLFENYSLLYQKLTHEKTKIRILKGVSAIIRIFRGKTNVYSDFILDFLETAWNGTEHESLLRLELLDCFTNFFELNPASLWKRYSFCLQLLRICTSPESGKSYLNERGFEMLRLFIENIEQSDENLDAIFADSFDYFRNNLHKLKMTYAILEDYALLRGTLFFTKFIEPIQKIVFFHFGTIKRSTRAPILSFVTLLVRMLQTQWNRLGGGIFGLILSDLEPSLNFANAEELEVSYRTLNVLCLLIYYDSPKALEIFANRKKEINAFLAVSIDTFERVPVLNVKRNLVIALACCLETKDFKTVNLVVEPLLQFCRQIYLSERSDGFLDVSAVESHKGLSCGQKRGFNLLQNEPINRIDMKTFIEEKLKKCVEINGGNVLQSVIASIGDEVKRDFANCK